MLGEAGSPLTQCGRAEACLHVKWHLDHPPFGHNTPTSRTEQTGQRPDGIGRTVLQTVAPKLASFVCGTGVLKLNV